MFLVPGLPFLVIVTVHYKEIRVFRERTGIILAYWKNWSCYIFAISCCGFIMRTTIQVWICLPHTLVALYVHNHLRQDRAGEVTQAISALSRVFPYSIFLCYI